LEFTSLNSNFRLHARKEYMQMIAQVYEDGDLIGVPILDSKERCWLKWTEDETADDFIKNASGGDTSHPYGICTVYINDIDRDQMTIYYYEVYCAKTNKMYFLITYRWEAEDWEDRFNFICVPRNHFNILIFLKEYCSFLNNSKIELG